MCMPSLAPVCISRHTFYNYFDVEFTKMLGIYCQCNEQQAFAMHYHYFWSKIYVLKMKYCKLLHLFKYFPVICREQDLYEIS